MRGHQPDPISRAAKPARAGQSMAEMAIFGSLMIMLLGVLVSHGLNFDYQQQSMMSTFRQALGRASQVVDAKQPQCRTTLECHTTVDGTKICTKTPEYQDYLDQLKKDKAGVPETIAEREWLAGCATWRNGSYMMLKDRHVPNSANTFGVGSFTPVSSSAAVTWSHRLHENAQPPSTTNPLPGTGGLGTLPRTYMRVQDLEFDCTQGKLLALGTGMGCTTQGFWQATNVVGFKPAKDSENRVKKGEWIDDPKRPSSAAPKSGKDPGAADPSDWYLEIFGQGNVCLKEACGTNCQLKEETVCLKEGCKADTQVCTGADCTNSLINKEGLKCERRDKPDRVCCKAANWDKCKVSEPKKECAKNHERDCLEYLPEETLPDGRRIRRCKKFGCGEYVTVFSDELQCPLVNIVDSCMGQIVNHESCLRQARMMRNVPISVDGKPMDTTCTSADAMSPDPAKQGFCVSECVRARPGKEDSKQLKEERIKCQKICAQGQGILGTLKDPKTNNLPWYAECVPGKGFVKLNDLFEMTKTMGLQPGMRKQTTSKNTLTRKEQAGTLTTETAVNVTEYTTRSIYYKQHGNTGAAGGAAGQVGVPIETGVNVGKKPKNEKDQPWVVTFPKRN